MSDTPVSRLDRLLSLPIPNDGAALDAFGWKVRHELFQARSQAGAQWEQLAAQARASAMGQRFVESPLTRRSLEKPRGYAGDAPMMDYVYRIVSALPDESAFGKRWLSYEVSCSGPAAARYRLRHAGSTIQRILQSRRRPSILALGAGHCRELQALVDRTQLKHAEFVALDQDAHSLEVAVKTFEPYVTPLKRSILQFIQSEDSERYDLIYSLGLFDYLGQTAARSVLASAFRMLRRDGELLIGNYHPSLVCSGYMESMMDWWLIYRDERDLLELTSGMFPGDTAQSVAYCDPIGAMTYLRVIKTS